LPVMAAYLFGSSAIGKNTADSDLDILLVVADSADLKTYHALVNSPFFSEVAVDWIVKHKSEFERSQSLGGVTMVAVQTGIRLKTDG
jgi:predicted nucleotidyltransferase